MSLHLFARSPKKRNLVLCWVSGQVQASGQTVQTLAICIQGLPTEGNECWSELSFHERKSCPTRGCDLLPPFLSPSHNNLANSDAPSGQATPSSNRLLRLSAHVVGNMRQTVVRRLSKKAGRPSKKSLTQHGQTPDGLSSWMSLTFAGAGLLSLVARLLVPGRPPTNYCCCFLIEETGWSRQVLLPG